MDRQLLERMIGAGVLILALILIVPAILDGQRDPDTEPDSAVENDAAANTDKPARTHTMLLDRPPESPPVARETPPAEESAVTQEETQESAVSEAPTTSPEISAADVSAEEIEPAAAEEKTAAKPRTEPDPEPVVKAVEASSKPPAKGGLYQVPESGWAVQLGSFADQQNAERLAKTVTENGFSVYLMPLRKSDQTLYRVRVGPRDSRPQASELAERLAEAGYKGRVVEQRPDS